MMIKPYRVHPMARRLGLGSKLALSRQVRRTLYTQELDVRRAPLLPPPSVFAWRPVASLCAYTAVRKGKGAERSGYPSEAEGMRRRYMNECR